MDGEGGGSSGVRRESVSEYSHPCGWESCFTRVFPLHDVLGTLDHSLSLAESHDLENDRQSRTMN